MPFGFLIINKPAGPTSHDIVDRVRRMTGEKRVGHAGTLDPFASGVLVVGTGREATREFPKLVGLDKKYRAILRLGATSDTDDRTGIITTTSLLSPPSDIGGPIHIGRTDDQVKIGFPMPLGNDKENIEAVLKKFTGQIMQVPPMYSAKKIKGKKLYELAREGKTVERTPVPIEIYSIVPAVYTLPAARYTLVINVHCSSGTYIRALARDIGEALGCGAYLEELERTAVGPFSIDEAVKADDLTKENIGNHLLDIDAVIAKSEATKSS
jgi:tRNA pseudouridine55 synthase